MKQLYFYDSMNGDDPQTTIIDETTLDAAERGENYLDPECFNLLGEFESPEEARQALWNEQGERLYWEQHPEFTTIIL